MCLIIEIPAGNTPEKWIVDSALKYNGDGVGIMHSGQATKWKSLGVDKVMQELEALHEVDVAIHFRMATDGKVNKSNAHPFKLKNRAWLMHNGILSAYRTTKDSAKSDTRQFVETFCNPLISEHGSIPKKELEQEIYGSAILIMQRDGGMNRYGSGWNCFDGCYYSNEYAWDCPTYASKYVSSTAASQYGYAAGESYSKYISDDYEDSAVRDSNRDASVSQSMAEVLSSCVDVLPFNDSGYIAYEDIGLQDELLEDEISAHDFLEYCTGDTLLYMYTWAVGNGIIGY